MSNYTITFNSLSDEPPVSIKAKGYCQEDGFFVFDNGAGRDAVVYSVNKACVVSIKTADSNNP